MDTPALDATGFVRISLRVIVFYFPVFLILLMMPVKPAHASGSVANVFSSCSNYLFQNSWSGYEQDGYTSAAAACGNLGLGAYVSNGNYNCADSTQHRALCMAPVFSCPANSTGSPVNNPVSCTCNDPYVPDPTATSCVTITKNLTIILTGKSTMLPASVLPFNAVVTDQNGIVQKDIQVKITVEVQGGTGGHEHNENRPKGNLYASGAACAPAALEPSCTLITDYSGQVSFDFISTPVSGTHTITATCNGCNTATASVDVKVPDLIPIPGSPYYALQDSAGNVIGAVKNKHSDNHYLTAAAIGTLTKFAINYQTTVLPYAKLYLNDASLVWGGLFDVGGTPWTSPHEGHDRGMSVDIRAENSGGQYEGAVPFANFDDTIKVAAKAGARAALHCQGSTVTAVCLGIPYNRHFHVDF